MSGVEIRVRADSTQARQDLSKLEKSVSNLEDKASSVGKAFRGLSLVIGAAFTGSAITRSFTTASDTISGLETRIKLVVGEGTKLQGTMKALYQVAKNARAPIGSTAEVFGRFGMALKGTGKTVGDILLVTQNVQKAVKISGGSAESANAALIQLGQGLASGTLRGEELNSVMEQAPRLARAIAEGMKIPFGELRAAAADGLVTTKVVFDAILGATEELDREFLLVGVKVRDLTDLMNNQLTRALDAIDKSLGFSAALKRAIMSFTVFFEYVANNFESWVLALKIQIFTFEVFFVEALFAIQQAWKGLFKDGPTELPFPEFNSESIISSIKNAWAGAKDTFASWMPDIEYPKFDAASVKLAADSAIETLKTYIPTLEFPSFDFLGSLPDLDKVGKMFWDLVEVISGAFNWLLNDVITNSSYTDLIEGITAGSELLGPIATTFQEWGKTIAAVFSSLFSTADEGEFGTSSMPVFDRFKLKIEEWSTAVQTIFSNLSKFIGNWWENGLGGGKDNGPAEPSFLASARLTLKSWADEIRAYYNTIFAVGGGKDGGGPAEISGLRAMLQEVESWKESILKAFEQVQDSLGFGPNRSENGRRSPMPFTVDITNRAETFAKSLSGSAMTTFADAVNWLADAMDRFLKINLGSLRSNGKQDGFGPYEPNNTVGAFLGVGSSLAKDILQGMKTLGEDAMWALAGFVVAGIKFGFGTTTLALAGITFGSDILASESFNRSIEKVGETVGEKIRSMFDTAEGDGAAGIATGITKTIGSLGRGLAAGLFGKDFEGELRDSIVTGLVAALGVTLLMPSLAGVIGSLGLAMATRLGAAIASTTLVSSFVTEFLATFVWTSMSGRLTPSLAALGRGMGRAVAVGMIAGIALGLVGLGASLGDMLSNDLEESFKADGPDLTMDEAAILGMVEGGSLGATLGAVLGAAIAGPVGALIGAAIAGSVGAALGGVFSMWNNSEFGQGVNSWILDLNELVGEAIVNGIIWAFESTVAGVKKIWNSIFGKDPEEELIGPPVKRQSANDRLRKTFEDNQSRFNLPKETLSEEARWKTEQARLQKEEDALAKVLDALTNNLENPLATATVDKTNTATLALTKAMDDLALALYLDNQMLDRRILALSTADKGFANGGYISGAGGPKDDLIPAMLSNGEFVINAEAVKKFGPGAFSALNNGQIPKFSLGGGPATGGSSVVTLASSDTVDLESNTQLSQIDKGINSLSDNVAVGQTLAINATARGNLLREEMIRLLQTKNATIDLEEVLGKLSKLGNGKSDKETADEDFARNMSEGFVTDIKSAFSNSFKSGDWEEFLPSILDSFTGKIIDSFVNGMVDGLMDGLLGGKDTQGPMDKLFNGVLNFGTKTGETVNGGVKAGFDLASDQSQKDAASGTGMFANLWSNLKGTFSNLWSSISGLVGGGAGGAGEGDLLGSILKFGTGLFMSEGGVVPMMSGARANTDSVPAMLTPGELVVPQKNIKDFMNSGSGGNSQVINLNVTGDISRQTKGEIIRMLPTIAAGVNANNRENNYKR